MCVSVHVLTRLYVVKETFEQKFKNFWGKLGIFGGNFENFFFF